MNKTLNITVRVAMLIALQIILERFCSIQTPIVRIGFGFVPIAVCATLYGPWITAAMAAVADVTGTVLFSAGFFPGITLSRVLTGLLFGFCLYGGVTFVRALIAASVNNLVISLFITSFWLSLSYGTPYWTTVTPRFFQVLILLPLQFAIMLALANPVKMLKKTV